MRSLDTITGRHFQEEEDHNLLDILADDRQESPEEPVMRGCLRGQIDTALGSLVGREAEIVKLYFGLDGEEPMTLDQNRRTIRAHARAGSPDKGKSSASFAAPQPLRSVAHLQSSLISSGPDLFIG